VAKRLGYPNVAILYRRTREEMPAHEWEIREGLEEGIEIHFLAAPVRIWGEEGRVRGLQCLRMRLGEPDASGRRRPIPVEGSEFRVEADLVLKAIGQGPDLRGMAEDPGLRRTTRGLIAADPACGLTVVPGVFAGGDAVHGPRTVVEAVAAGKAAARSMDRYLRGEPVNGQGMEWEGVPAPPAPWKPQQREPMPRLSLQERRRSFREVELGFSQGQAVLEASRCLRICGFQE
jgi:NADPH-dependent glutamate synthase beta subunit-like oxidoreductase